MLVHVDDGLLVIVQKCLDTQNLHIVTKYDVEDSITDIVVEWCNNRIADGNCGEHAEEFMNEWKKTHEDKH